MATFFEYAFDALLRIVIVFGVVVVPVALVLYLLIAYAGKFFSPLGRITRLTYWEGLTAWFLGNVFGWMATIVLMMYSANFMAKSLGDTDYIIYTKLFLSIFFIGWVLSLWSLAAICAKRWRDLHLPAAMAAINIAPVFLVGWVLLAFFGGVGRDMFHRLIVDANAFGPGLNAFSLFVKAKAEYYQTYLHLHWIYYYFVTTVILGAFLYLGMAEGAPVGHASRKKSSSGSSPRPSRA